MAVAVARRKLMSTKTKRQLYIALVTLAVLLAYAAPAFACLGASGSAGGC